MKKIGTEGSAAMKEVADKAPAATGEAFKRLGHEYKTNKDLRNYTAGAVALPVVITTAVLGGPTILAGANAAGRVAASGAGAVASMADKATRNMYGRVAVEAEKAATAMEQAMPKTAAYFRNSNAGEIVNDAIDLGASFLPDGLPPSLTEASVLGGFIMNGPQNLKDFYNDITHDK